MSDCLYCNKPCEGAAVFCDDCRNSLLSRHGPPKRTTYIVPEIEYTPARQRPGEGSYETQPVLPASLSEDVQDKAPLPEQRFQAAPVAWQQNRRQFLSGPQLFTQDEDNATRERDTGEDEVSSKLASPPLAMGRQHAEAIAPVTAPAKGEQTRKLASLPAARVLRIAGSRKMRLAWPALIVLALLIIAADSLLLHTGFSLVHRFSAPPGTPPMLTITPAMVYPGQTVRLRIAHFPALTPVAVSRDMQVAVPTASGSPLAQVGADGSADVAVRVAQSWGPGYHLIEAEDVVTHYAISATLQVTGHGPLLAPHLQLGRTTLNMGAAAPGANTLQPLLLRNTGSGSIAWVARSDQPWLVATPAQGSFNNAQQIIIAVSRTTLAPGDYRGRIAVSSTAGPGEELGVTMTVHALPARPGAVIALSPPALSFTAIDHEADPAGQLMTISNPGSQPLYWSLAPKALPWPAGATNQDTPPVSASNWLSASPASGVLAPGQHTSIQVIVHSYALLPGVYTLLLSLTSARQALDTPQMLAVSLTVQPGCRLAPSTGNLSFTTASGQHNPPGQFISLGLTSGCTRAVPWQTFSSNSWLTVTPGSGQLWTTASTLADIQVDTRMLRQGTYSGFIVFSTPQSSQTVMVQITLLPISASASQVAAAQATSATAQATSSTAQATSQAAQLPAMLVSPTALGFSATQGGANPPAQLVAISASSGAISWQASITTGARWLSMVPAQGSVPGGQAQQMAVHVDTSGLAPGTYSTQIAVTATSASGQAVQGAPQTIAISLTILRPCSLQVAPTSLSFSSSVLQPDPPAQSVTLKEVGDCARPVSWSASPDANSSSWLQVSATSGRDNGSGSSITVTINAQGKLLGHYSGQITLAATDNTGTQVQNAPQVISVTLTVVG
ncbi:MAG: hypothetical protein ABI456_11470 [Ktedonobacteraceae bacterium]